MNFGERIVQARQRIGWKREELAARIGVKYQTLSKYETSEREPDFETLLKICDALRVSVDHLLGHQQEQKGEDDMERETKKARFVRVAEKRVEKILQAIRLVGNLANKSVYEYTDEDIEKIFAALAAEIEKQKEKFKQGKKKAFSLADPVD